MITPSDIPSVILPHSLRDIVFLAFYLAKILTFFLWYLYSDLVSGILSDSMRLNDLWLHFEKGADQHE